MFHFCGKFMPVTVTTWADSRCRRDATVTNEHLGQSLRLGTAPYCVRHSDSSVKTDVDICQPIGGCAF